MKRVKKVTIGSDPEVFLTSKETGKFVSVIGKLGGTKEKPRPLVDGIFVQEDNVLAEFNIPPADTKHKFTKSIKRGLELVQQEVDSFANISILPYAFFEKEELTNYKAVRFGCAPDMSCWTGRGNPEPRARNRLLRTAGGHIAIGYNSSNPVVSQELGKAMDVFISTPSYKMSDEQPRRELYGKMGAIRFKSFGLEYRTPSNFWLTNEGRVNWAYEQTMRAIDFVNNNRKITQEHFEALEAAIDLGIEGAVEYLFEEFKLEVA